MQPKPPRPTGVTILAILSILAGLGGLVFGGLLLAAAAIVNTLNLAANYPQLATYNISTATFAAILGIFGAVLLILGLLNLVLGIGFLGGKRWAWILGIIAAVLNIVIDIPAILFFGSTSAFGLIIAIIILYYLTRPRVKAFFGRGPGVPGNMGPSMMPASAMGSTSSGQMGGMATIKCPACGASVAAGSTKCPNCGAML